MLRLFVCPTRLSRHTTSQTKATLQHPTHHPINVPAARVVGIMPVHQQQDARSQVDSAHTFAKRHAKTGCKTKVTPQNQPQAQKPTRWNISFNARGVVTTVTPIMICARVVLPFAAKIIKIITITMCPVPTIPLSPTVSEPTSLAFMLMPRQKTKRSTQTINPCL